jgi:hypothetical protein
VHLGIFIGLLFVLLIGYLICGIKSWNQTYMVYHLSPRTDYEIVKMQNQLSHIMGKTLVDFKGFYSNE